MDAPAGEDALWYATKQVFADPEHAIKVFNATKLNDWVVEQNFRPPLIAAAVYLPMIFLIIPALRPAKSGPVAKFFFCLWNFFLSAFSTVGMVATVPYFLRILQRYGIYYITCNDEIMTGPRELDAGAYGLHGIMYCVFMLSKIPELGDTLFLAWMRKPISFLHWYHHCTVLVFAWYAAHFAAPLSLGFGAINYSVHSIMYFYFGAACYTKKLSFLRMPITTMQLAQMFVGLALTGLAYYYTFFTPQGCTDTYTKSKFFEMCGVIYGSYAILFAKLFVDNYITKKPKRKADKKKSA